MFCWALGAALAVALVALIRSRATIKRQHSEIKRLRFDELTGFLVRREFMTHAEPIRVGSVVAILDLDGLKGLNDRFGHGAGDEFLRAVADRIRRGGDQRKLVGRIGGDEFGIVLESPASMLDLRAELSRPLCVYGVAVSVSCGAAEAEPGVSFSELLRGADKAMYEDKRNRKTQMLAASTRAA